MFTKGLFFISNFNYFYLLIIIWMKFAELTQSLIAILFEDIIDLDLFQWFVLITKK